MLPTPKKSHYIFNLRDLSKLVTGLMQASSIVIINKDHLVELFVHESIRIFNDRLVSVEDNKLFYNHLSETVADYFKVHIQNPFYKPVEQKSVHSKQVTQKLKQTPDSEENADIVLYGDFMKSDERIYQPLKNWKQIVGVLSDYQMRSSSGFISKQIVFFKEAVEHICRLIDYIKLISTLNHEFNHKLNIEPVVFYDNQKAILFRLVSMALVKTQ